MDQQAAARQRIRSVFDGLGLREGAVRGASDSEIDQFAAEQGVARVPAAVREVLRLVGAEPGVLFAGTHFGVRYGPDGAYRREIADRFLDRPNDRLQDPAGMLVLSAHQGYIFEVIDGADLDQPDPPVWSIVESDVDGGWRSTSRWFSNLEVVVERLRREIEYHEDNGWDPPRSAPYILPRAALTPPSPSPAERVREIVERVFSAGLRRDAVAGASDEDIGRFATAQGLAQVPTAVHALLRLLGSRTSTLWFGDQLFGVHTVDAETKRKAVAAARNLAHRMRDPEGLLVLAAYPGSTYYVIDGADIDNSDPPVWDIQEGERARKEWGSTTGWLDKLAPDVTRSVFFMRLRQKEGKPLPDWAQDVHPL